MTIPYFADQQNLVFIPALLALLVATLLICLPIVFAPALRRGSRARARVVSTVAGVVAAAALVTAGWQGGVGVRTLQAERAGVAQQVRDRYGVALTADQVGELLNGGAPKAALPALAERLRLRSTAQGLHALRLDVQSDGTYALVYGGQAVPQA